MSWRVNKKVVVLSDMFTNWLRHTVKY